MREPAVVPLIVPSKTTLRAGAVWVTIANWAEALADRYGDAEVVAGPETIAVSDLRGRIFDGDQDTRRSLASTVPQGIRQGTLFRQLGVFAGDLRMFRRGRALVIPDERNYREAPYVWQHHDLFHNSGRELADRLGVPLVQFVDAPQIWESERWGVSHWPISGALERYGESPQLKTADLVACVSGDVASAVEQGFKVDRERIVVSPCSVDVSVFNDAQPLDLRELCGLPPESVLVGWMGSFRRFHAVDRLVDAFAIAVANMPELKLVLIGDGATREAVEQQVERLAIRDKVRFLGSVPHTQIPSTLKALDLAVLPSDGTEFHYSPLKLREYAAAGVAIVAASAGEVGETFSQDEAVMVEPGNDGALAGAIAALAGDATRRHALGKAAHSAATLRFGMEPILQSVEFALGIG